jgi:hypothetical protein
MTNEAKIDEIDNLLNIDKNILTAIAEESSHFILDNVVEFSMFNTKPMDNSHLAITLKHAQAPFVSYVGDPSIISRYILKTYIKEDYDIFLQTILKKIKNYGKFVNIDFQRFTKMKMNITLADDYQSIQDIDSFDLVYMMLIKTHQYYQVKADISIVFNGDSVYDFKYTQGDYATLKMVINYNDLDGFLMKFAESYRDEISKKLGVEHSTDMWKMLALAEMFVI